MIGIVPSAGERHRNFFMTPDMSGIAREISVGV